MVASEETLPETLTPDDVAQVLGVHRYTVYKLLRDGRLRGFRVSNRWRVQRKELERFMETTQFNYEEDTL